MIQINIDNELCLGCKFCAQICPKMVLHTAGGYVATVIDVNRCNLCLECMNKCPEHAIEVKQI